MESQVVTDITPQLPGVGGGKWTEVVKVGVGECFDNAGNGSPYEMSLIGEVLSKFKLVVVHESVVDDHDEGFAGSQAFNNRTGASVTDDKIASRDNLVEFLHERICYNGHTIVPALFLQLAGRRRLAILHMQPRHASLDDGLQHAIVLAIERIDQRIELRRPNRHQTSPDSAPVVGHSSAGTRCGFMSPT